MTAGPPPPPPSTSDPSLRAVARRVARHRVLLGAVFVVVTAAVAAYTFVVTPRYRSAARLRIETKQSSPSGLADQLSAGVAGAGGGLLGLGRDELETEIAVLRSDRITDAMIDSLALGVQVKKPAGSRARILAARVVDPAMDATGTLTLTQDTPGHYRVEKTKLEDVRTVPATIAAGDSMRIGGFEITLSRELARGGPSPIVIRILPRYQVHKLLESRLLITRQEGGSRLVEVSFEDPDRVLASQVVNRIISEYAGYTNTTERTEDTITVAQLQREVDSTARSITQAESALRAFEEHSRLIAPEEQATEQVKRIAAISTKVDAVSVERNALARMIAIIQQRSKGGTDASAFRQLATFPSLITNRAIQDLLQSLVDLENKRSALGVRRTEQNEEYKQLTDRITEIERQLGQLGPQYLESLDQELATTANAVTALSDTLQAMPGAAMRYGQLLRDRTVREATYIALQKQLKQAQLKDVLRQDRVKIIDAPRVANLDDPAFPKKPVMIVLGAVFGLALAFAAGLFLVLWEGPVQDPPAAPLA